MGFSIKRDAFPSGFLGELESLLANVSTTLPAHDAGGERDIFQASLVFPLLHLRVRAQRGVNWLGKRKELDPAVHAFGIFAKHHLIDRDVFAAGIGDLISAIIERVAGITFARPHVGVQVEHLAQPDDGRKVNQPFVFQFRRQFFLGLRLRLAGDGAEQTAGGFLQCLNCAIRQRVTFLAPKFPADVARHIFGIEFQTIQYQASRLHNVVANSVTRHPCNFVFSHLSSDLIDAHRSSQASAAVAAVYDRRLPPKSEKLCGLLSTKPTGHQIFGPAGHD